MRVGVLFACLAQAGVASAGPVADEVAAGEALAQKGRWTDAIVAFKRADEAGPRATHACLIGLAYLRRELPTQARYYFDLCRARATASDTLPDWLGLAEEQLASLSVNARLVPLTVRLRNAPADAKIELSAAPGEQFLPLVLHLPPGKHLVTAHAAGARAVDAVIELRDGSPRELVLAFAVPAASGKPAPPTRRDETPPSRLPLVVGGLGAATLAGGLAYHLVAFKPARDELAAAPDPASYDRLEGRFDRRRQILFAMYGVGAAAAVTGAVLHLTGTERSARAPIVTAQLGREASGITLEWRR